MRPARVLVPCLLAGLAACASTSGDAAGSGRANAIVQEDVQRAIDEIPYLHGRDLLDRMEWLAAQGPAATPRLREALGAEDWLTRASVAYVLGRIGDRRNIPAVRKLLSDPVRDVRYQAAEALVELGDAAGFRTLVEGLSDGDLRNRYKCFEVLREATGQDFGYAHDADPEARRAAVARWLDWIESLKPNAL